MLKIHDLTEIQELDRDAMNILNGGRSLYWFSNSDKRSALVAYEDSLKWEFERNVLNLQ